MSDVKLLELKYVPKITIDYSKYSDTRLMQLCQKYGTQTILWRQRFIGLLPEVNRRKLYEKKGYASIVEFGKRMAGLSEAQIRLVINLERKFEDKPVLHEALVKGEISMNKLVRVASIATAENESELVKCASILSKASLDVLVKDVKNLGKSTAIFERQNGFLEPQIDVKSLPGHTEAKRRYLSEHDEKGVVTNSSGDAENSVKPNFQLSPEVIQKLNALHAKGIDVNETILKMLEKREEEITINKDVQRDKILEREASRKEEGKAPNRNVSVVTKRILKEEYGTKCSLNDCTREAVHIHHTVPFALSQSNDPNLLRPLRRAHHDILHTINSRYVLEKLG